MNKLVNFCKKIGSGATPKGGKNSYRGGEYNLVRSQNVLDLEFSYKGLVQINKFQAGKLNNVELESEDILLNITGDSVARCCMVPKDILPARVNQHVAIIRTNKDILCPYFLKYLLVSKKMKKFLLSLAGSGGTRNALTKQMIEDLEFDFPNIKNQKQISDKLKLLDQKIVLNNQENKILNDLVNLIFDFLFVYFEPIHSNINKTSINLDKKILDLFPNSLKDTEIGQIPSDWEIIKIKDLFETVLGGTPSRKNTNYWDGTNGWINSGALNNFPLLTPSEYISDTAAKNTSTKFSKKSTLIGLVTQINESLITFSEIDVFINQSIVAIQPNNIMFPEYIYLYLKKHQKRLYSAQTGGAQQHINKEVINNFQIVKPSAEVLNYTKNIFHYLFEKIKENSLENIELKKFRDLILQRLVYKKK